jgi:hypothetical protein
VCHEDQSILICTSEMMIAVEPWITQIGGYARVQAMCRPALGPSAALGTFILGRGFALVRLVRSPASRPRREGE